MLSTINWPGKDQMNKRKQGKKKIKNELPYPMPTHQRPKQILRRFQLGGRGIFLIKNGFHVVVAQWRQQIEHGTPRERSSAWSNV